MSVDSYLQQQRLFGEITHCPQCQEWLWNEDADCFDKRCARCGWTDPNREPELPEHIQDALAYMEDISYRLTFGETLTPNQRQLLAQAGVYVMEDKS